MPFPCLNAKSSLETAFFLIFFAPQIIFHLEIARGCSIYIKVNFKFNKTRSLSEMPFEEIFADEIGKLTLSQGVVRCDFISRFADSDASESVKNVASVSLSLPGLLRAWNSMELFVGKLVESGILKKDASRTDTSKHVVLEPEVAASHSAKASPSGRSRKSLKRVARKSK